MMTMTLYIAFTISLGIVLGWFLSKFYYQPQVQEKVRRLTKSDAEKRIMELEALYLQEKDLAVEQVAKNRELKGELLKKITLLSSTSEALKNIQYSTSKDAVKALQKELERKNQELEDFGEVLKKYEDRFTILEAQH